MNTNISIELIRDAKRNGGVTYNPVLGVKNPHFGYMVSIEQNCLIVKALNPSLLQSYLIDHKDFFKKYNSYLGIWFNEGDGQYYIDCSELIFDLEGAKRLGMTRNQLAIYDNKNKQVINL